MGFLTQDRVTQAATIGGDARSRSPSSADPPMTGTAMRLFHHEAHGAGGREERASRGIQPGKTRRFPKRCEATSPGKTIVSPRGGHREVPSRALDERNRLDRDRRRPSPPPIAFGAVGGSMEEAIWRGRAYADAGVGPRVWAALSSSGPRAQPLIWPARHGASPASEAAAGLQLLLVIQVEPGLQPAHLPRARGARLQVHLHHALRRPRRHVLGSGITCTSW
jgi:hypothetical protein